MVFAGRSETVRISYGYRRASRVNEDTTTRYCIRQHRKESGSSNSTYEYSVQNMAVSISLSTHLSSPARFSSSLNLVSIPNHQPYVHASNIGLEDFRAR